MKTFAIAIWPRAEIENGDRASYESRPSNADFRVGQCRRLENRRYNAGDFRTCRAAGWRSSTATNETKPKREKTMNPNKTTQLKLTCSAIK